MDDKIFILNNNGELSELVESEYDSEDLLQGLLSEYHQLLAGSQIDEVNPRNWILVRREIGVPDKENAGNRWSLDHLFIDQDAIPTLVEVKRSTDTRIRREVIGQILDYAANAVAYWSIESLEATYEEQCKTNDINPNDAINQLIDDDSSFDEFWEQVSTNLKAGKIRMLIIADKIPHELKNIIEFLNQQMSPAEILGIEIKQFKNDELKTLVPKVIGKTAISDSKKKVKKSINNIFDIDYFYESMIKHSGKSNQRIAQEIIEALVEYSDYNYFGGSGIEEGLGHSILPTKFIKINGKKKKIYLFSIWTNGSIEIHLQYLKNRGSFGTMEKQQAIINQLNSIENVNFDYDKAFKRPNFQLSILENKSERNKLINILKQIHEAIDNEFTE